jgi:superfamily II DNA or RNA helicase
LKIVRSKYLEIHCYGDFERITVQRYLDKQCVYPNPKYDKAVKRKKITGYITETQYVKTYKVEKLKNGTTIFKVLKANRTVFVDVINNLGLKVDEIVDERICVPARMACHAKPRDKMQEQAIKDVINNEWNYGILSASPAFGKTYCAIDIMCRLKVKTLIVVDMSLLIEQFLESIHKFTKVHDTRIGIIKAKDRDIENKDIIIATAQTLSKDEKLLKQLSKFVSFLIIDEVQIASCDMIQKIVKELVPKYQLGLSGTPYRDDGMDFLITESVGPIIHKANRKDLVDAGSMVTPILRPIFIKDNNLFEKYNLNNDVDFRTVVDEYYNNPKVIDKVTNIMLYHLNNNDSQLAICKEKTMVNEYYKTLLLKLRPSIIEDVKKYNQKIIREYHKQIEEINNTDIFKVVPRKEKNSYEKGHTRLSTIQKHYSDKLQEYKEKEITKVINKIEKLQNKEWFESDYIEEQEDLQVVRRFTANITSSQRDQLVEEANSGKIKILIVSTVMDKAISISRLNIEYLLFSTRERNNTVQRVG